MADTLLTNISASLASVFENFVAPQINRSGPGFQLLRKVPAWSGAVNWNMSVGTAVPTTAPIADGADVTVYNRDTVVKATLPFTTYHDAFAMSGLAQAIARVAGNPADLSNLQAYEFTRSSQRLGAALASDCYVGTGASEQLMGMIDPTAGGIIDTGTYAGVVRGTYAQAAGNVINANSGNITIAQMRAMNTKIKKASATGRSASVILASPIAFDKYAGLFDPNRIYTSNVNEIDVGGRKITLDGGVMATRFDGIPVVCDVRIPETTTGSFIFLNLDEIAFVYVPQPTAQDWISGNITLSPEGEYMSTGTGLMGKFEKLAKTGDKDKWALYVYGQLQVRSPNAHGWIYGVNIS